MIVNKCLFYNIVFVKIKSQAKESKSSFEIINALSIFISSKFCNAQSLWNLQKSQIDIFWTTLKLSNFSKIAKFKVLRVQVLKCI